MKSSAFYAVLGAGVLIVILVILWGLHGSNTPHKNTQSNATSTAVLATTTPPLTGLSIYTTGQYGFSFFYPGESSATSTFDTHYLLPNSWRIDAVGTGTPIVQITGYHTENDASYPRYFVTELRVGISTDPVGIAACTKAGPSETKVSPTQIQGTSWSTFTFGDAGMMQYLKGTSYRTVHDGACYALEQLQTGSSYHDVASTSDIPEATLTSHYDDLSAIVKTFSFVRP